MIGEDGAQMGIFSSKEAMRVAHERGYDLVKIAPQAVPPVCKIMDYSKFYFEQTKREKDARKNQKVVVLKEIQLHVNIDEHDIQTKLNHAMRFLNAGNKVKVTMRLRSREIQRPEMGVALMNRFAASLTELGTVEKPPKQDGRNILMIVVPKPDKEKADKDK